MSSKSLITSILIARFFPDVFCFLSLSLAAMRAWIAFFGSFCLGVVSGFLVGSSSSDSLSSVSVNAVGLGSLLGGLLGPGGGVGLAIACGGVRDMILLAV